MEAVSIFPCVWYEDCSVPVDRSDQAVQGECGVVSAVLTPDGVTLVLSNIVWAVESVVDGGDNDEEPREDREDLVGPDGLRVVGVALGEGVDWMRG